MAGRARGQDEANPSFDWLTEQVRWAHLVRSGWLDISFVLFFCVFMDRDDVEVHKNGKERTRPIFSR